MRERVARIVDALPAWSASRVTPLAGGSSNGAWRLARDGRYAVLKVNGQSTAAAPDRRFEARCQRHAANAGLAPAVIAVGDDWLLSAYAPGEALRPADLGEPSALQTIAAHLRHLHALPCFGRMFDAAAAADGYLPRALRRDRIFAAHCCRIVAELSSWPASELSPASAGRAPCHNDLVAANVIRADGDSGTLHFIDWEFAADNDPYFDLATIVAHHDLDERSARTLLAAYAGGEADGDRLALQIRRYDALHWLWLAARDPENTRLDAIAARIATSGS